MSCYSELNALLDSCPEWQATGVQKYAKRRLEAISPFTATKHFGIKISVVIRFLWSSTKRLFKLNETFTCNYLKLCWTFLTMAKQNCTSCCAAVLKHFICSIFRMYYLENCLNLGHGGQWLCLQSKIKVACYDGSTIPEKKIHYI